MILDLKDIKSLKKKLKDKDIFILYLTFVGFDKIKNLVGKDYFNSLLKLHNFS